MTKPTRAQLLRTIRQAKREVRQLAKLFPSCFDKRGKPIVAVATFKRAAQG